MTIKDMMTSKQKMQMLKWGFAANLYGNIARIFRSEKALDKAVEYLDKRWELMMGVAFGKK